MVAMSAATLGRNRTGERMAGYREKSGEPVTVVDGGKEGRRGDCEEHILYVLATPLPHKRQAQSTCQLGRRRSCEIL